MTANRLIYLPLGGAGEVGMNAYVYGYGPEGKERLILVDLGVTFPDMDTTPGVDLILPDMTWLAERADRLEAIFITHAHEDHIGALGHLWGKLRAPVFARDFTARLSRLKMEENGHAGDEVTTVGARPDAVEAGPFSVQFVPVSHSLPEASSLIIDTPAGRIVHTGDFKLDATPGVGEPWDPAAMHEIAAEGRGVKALVCDSTNVMVGHPGRSEATLSTAIADLVRNAPGMVVATTFASNVARLRTLAQAARESGRSICLLGRAMHKMVGAAQDARLLTDFPPTVTPEAAQDIPRENLMLIVTGSQGERRAASAQLARGKYMGLSLKEGDLFLFSSKTIPGNERGVLRIVNQLSEAGVDVVDDSLSLYHVSGHANRPDLQEVHRIIKAEMLIPMHGEHRHLRAHAKLGAEAGMATEVVTNGMMVNLAGLVPEVVEYVDTSRVYLDGTAQVGAMDGVVRDRIRLALSGHVTVTMIIDEDGRPLGEPWAEALGLPRAGRSGASLADVLEEELTAYVERADRRTLKDDGKLEDGLRRVVRQVTMEEIGKKPEVSIVISRLLDD
jgi:ribonuclease J